MSSIYTINENESACDWDKFISKSLQNSIFSQTKFLNCLPHKYRLVTCYCNNKISGGVVVFENENKNFVLEDIPFTQYHGILLADNSDSSYHTQITQNHLTINALIKYLTKKYDKLVLSHHWRLQDMRPFQWYNYHQPATGHFRISLCYTGILKLNQYKNFDHYLQNIRSVRRQEYKKGMSLLRMEESTNILILDELHKKTFLRQGIDRKKVIDLTLNNICKAAFSQNFGKLIIAYDDKKPVSAIFYIYDMTNIYYLIAANDPDNRKISGNVYLLCNLIKKMFSQGIKEIDMVGVNSPQRGDFKTSFNALIKPYYQTELN